MEIGFTSETILDIGELVAECSHYLCQHYASVGFDDLGPVWIPLRGEIQERTAQAREVASQVVHREIDQARGRTFGFPRLAIEIARAALFE